MPDNSELDSKRAVTESLLYKDAKLISMEKNSEETRTEGPNNGDKAQIFSAEPSGQLWEVKISSAFGNLEEPFRSLPVDVEFSGASSGHASEIPNSGKLKPMQVDAINEVGHMGAECEGIELQLRKRKARQTSAVSSSWALHEKSPEKFMVFEPGAVLSEGNTSGEQKRRGRKKKEFRCAENTQYRDGLPPIASTLVSTWPFALTFLEKLRPEKELQNAKSHILRYKLKIRELFQHIDQSLAVGKLPESLFDSKGEIYSEDIFCAKCGSKDLQVDNDIILCDGACQRGFHQFCLEPPLLKEQIPPGDESWLCPGCDCKIDCLHMLKDFQESKVSILDNWEKIFPEAVAASGKKLDDTGMSSDDSEDDDYDPDKPDRLEKVTGDESRSDGCPDLSASEVLVTPPDNGKYFVLPSDDSEDDDFVPVAPDKDELVKHETSSSDFSSDSEDLVGLIDDADVHGVDTGHSLPPPGHGSPSSGYDRRKSKVDDLSYLLVNSEEPTSSKRHVERLDYKKLHDMDMKDENQEEIENGPERTHKTFTEMGAQSSSAIVDSDGSKNRRSTYKILSDAQTQRLFKSFQENQYPERAVKENLAKDLGLSIQQVGKWFDNTRWRFNHRPQTLSYDVESAQINNTSVQGNEPGLENATVTNNNSSDRAAECQESNAVVSQNPYCSSQSGQLSS
ncbi:hypothetical protein F511_16243 [Dorcoceras hygrometricum]|uniref:Uncharacterized protein n=1 Tax=Dorcoceras hygrometricum TaxID=472368 RepID=A0A2Z7BIF5_9LAMI|nr:hypothetical protein F511_16243 [Dorcoceras hygrometricum]